MDIFKSTQKGLFKNVKDQSYRHLGSQKIQKAHVATPSMSKGDAKREKMSLPVDHLKGY